jgi:hypothetical protein
MNPRGLTLGCSRRPWNWTLRSLRPRFPRYARPRLSQNVLGGMSGLEVRYMYFYLVLFVLYLVVYQFWDRPVGC